MKKIIAAIIRAIMPKAIKEHENKRKHNANMLQHLLDTEHYIRDRVNEQYDTVYTTKKALQIGCAKDFIVYNSFEALKEADFR